MSAVPLTGSVAAMRGWMLLLGCVGACAPVSRPIKPVVGNALRAEHEHAPSTSAPAASSSEPPVDTALYAQDEVRVRASLPNADEALVFAEMRRGDRNAWLAFFPDGDDLAGLYAEFGPQVSQELCQANVRWLWNYVEGWSELRPKVSLDPDACATPARLVVSIEPGEPPAPEWFHFERQGPRWLAIWDEYADGTELWLWSLIPAKPATPPDQRVFDAWELEAVAGGVPPLLDWAE